MTTKKIEFNAKNVKPFALWLKKFSSIDNALLLEVDEINKIFIAKTYNEERSVVKSSMIKFDEAGFIAKDSKEPARIKVGIYNISRLMKIIDQFNDKDFLLIINYDEIIGETSELAGLTIQLKNKDLKMNIDCASLNIFNYISDDLFSDTIATLTEVNGIFNLTKSQIEQTNSLCNLDNDNVFMEFKQKNKIISVAGDSFELEIDQNDSEKESDINIFKDQFDSIDVEDYYIKMGEDRLVFTSVDDNTTTVISKVEKE